MSNITTTHKGSGTISLPTDKKDTVLTLQVSYATARGRFYDVDIEHDAFDSLDLSAVDAFEDVVTNIVTFSINVLLFLVAATGLFAAIAAFITLGFVLASTPEGLVEAFVPLMIVCGSIIGGTSLVCLLASWTAGMPFRLALRHTAAATAVALAVGAVILQVGAWVCIFGGLIPSPQFTSWLEAAVQMLTMIFSKGTSAGEVAMVSQGIYKRSYCNKGLRRYFIWCSKLGTD